MRSECGFSLTELMFVLAVTATLMAVAVPLLTDVSENSKFTTAVRTVERELQSARLKAVSHNTVMRVRMNCPSAGYIRTVEVVGNATIDDAADRCGTARFPFPAADDELATRPNHDGPPRVLPEGSAVDAIVLQFTPDGNVTQVVGNVPQRIDGSLSVQVQRGYKYKSVTINGAGKIQLQ